MTFLLDNSVYHELTIFNFFFYFSTVLFKPCFSERAGKVRQMNKFQSASETLVPLALDSLTGVY